VAASFGPDYTQAAEMRFNHHHQAWEQKLARYQEKKGSLLQFMLGTLSSPSYEALMNIPAFPLAKAARDTRAIWKLFRQVHLRSSAAVNQSRLMTHLSSRQVGTHDSYVCRLRDTSSLVKMAFESSNHPGHISLDTLDKCIYING